MVRRVKDIIKEYLEEFELKERDAINSYNLLIRNNENNLAKKQAQYLKAYSEIIKALRALV